MTATFATTDEISDIGSDMDSLIIEDDLVVGKCAGKVQFVLYIAWVNIHNGEEFQFEGVFLQKAVGKVGADKPAFVPNPKDEASFNLDVMHKLPQPEGWQFYHCSGQLVVSCNLLVWQLN